MSLQIDCVSFDKAAHWPELIALPNGRRVGRGYEARLDRPSQLLRGIVLHSSEDAAGQTFSGLCRYLRDSPDVSTHYVVGRAGEVARVLDPGPYLAYHAGVSRWTPGPACNLYMIGIEIMHTQRGPVYTPMQLNAVRRLCQTLMADHPTIRKSNVVLHKWIALPLGRKSDPTDLSDAFWHTWIATL